MGRNADKRRARKHFSTPSADGVAVAIEDSALSTGVAAPTSEIPAWAERALGLPAELPPTDSGTLAHALFRVTSLLSLRDAGGAVPAKSLVRVAGEVARIIEGDTVSLLRLDPGDDLVPSRLVLMASHGLAVGDEGVVSFDVGDGVAGLVASSGDVVRIEDAPRDPRFQTLYGQRTEIGSIVAVPLRYGSRILGVLAVSRREIRAFSDLDIERLQVVGSWVAQDLEHGRMFYAAVTDPLTGLYSRFALLHGLPREVEIARRYQMHLSLVLLDIDGLAEVNTRDGREVGDRLLIESGRRLLGAVRAADLAVRFGGDELAVLLPMTPPNQARATAKRFVRLLSAPIPGVSAPIEWSASVATLAAQLDEDALGLLWRCDRGLAEAKAQGGNTIVAAPLERLDP